jgi:hypothetical protein
VVGPSDHARPSRSPQPTDRFKVGRCVVMGGAHAARQCDPAADTTLGDPGQPAPLW